jgi:hypothetical protein
MFSPVRVACQRPSGAPDLATLQLDLDAVRMRLALRQDAFHGALGELARGLVVLLDNSYALTGAKRAPDGQRHYSSLSSGSWMWKASHREPAGHGPAPGPSGGEQPVPPHVGQAIRPVDAQAGQARLFTNRR